jgi:hypothetical protein
VDYRAAPEDTAGTRLITKSTERCEHTGRKLEYLPRRHLAGRNLIRHSCPIQFSVIPVLSSSAWWGLLRRKRQTPPRPLGQLTFYRWRTGAVVRFGWGSGLRSLAGFTGIGNFAISVTSFFWSVRVFPADMNQPTPDFSRITVLALCKRYESAMRSRFHVSPVDGLGVPLHL